MGDDLMGMLSGPSEPEETGDQPKGDPFGGLLGGAGGAGGLGALLGGLIGGAPVGGGSGSEDLMGGLLGGLLGGGTPPSTSAETGGGLGDLMGGLLGGDAPNTNSDDAGGLGGLLGGGAAGGLGGLLGGLLGGGNPMTFGGGGGPMLPFANTLAEKLGISPQMANMLIMGAIGLLTASAAKRQSGRSVSLADVSDSDYIRSSGMASRLSAQMGISEDDAVRGLQQAMGLMATQGGAAAPPSKTGVKKARARKSGQVSATKPARKATKTTPKKSSKPETGSDFMDLLDDPS